MAGLRVYSLDYLDVKKGDALNLLEKMSNLTGELAVEDAISKIDDVKKVVILGFGSVGKSAYNKVCELGYDNVVVFCTQDKDAVQIRPKHKAHLLDKNVKNMKNNQDVIQSEILDANVVIASARSRDGAPILISKAMLKKLKNIVIVDLAISDGGNIEGSQHDKDLIFENNVIVSNISGYPKKKPLQASQLWSTSSRIFIEKLTEGDEVVASSLIM